MAREVNLVCNFIFGFVCTNLPLDMVDAELMVRTVQGIYTYRKANISHYVQHMKTNSGS